MTKKSRRKFSAEFKAKVVFESFTPQCSTQDYDYLITITFFEIFQYLIFKTGMNINQSLK